MNIGINASFLRKPGNGIGQVTLHFLTELAKQVKSNRSLRNHKFFIYTEDPIDIKLPKNFIVRSFLPFYRRDDLFRKLLWEKYSLLHKAHRDHCDVFISLYQSATVIKYIDMKHVMIVHDVIPHACPEYINNLRKKLYWERVEIGMYSASSIVAVSEYTKSDLEDKLNIKATKITVAPIAVDPIFTRDVVDDEIQHVMQKYNLAYKKYMYTGGGLEVRKNVDRTLRAYKMLREQIPNAPDLVVSGKLLPHLAPLITDVEQVVYDLGLVDHVKILGFVDQVDLPALYKGAQVFIFPSSYEGFGMPVLEAMTIGTPVITSSDTSLREVGGDAVRYVNHDDAQLCDAMREIITNSALQEKMSYASKERAQIFSWTKFVEKIREVSTI